MTVVMRPMKLNPKELWKIEKSGAMFTYLVLSSLLYQLQRKVFGTSHWSRKSRLANGNSACRPSCRRCVLGGNRTCFSGRRGDFINDYDELAWLSIKNQRFLSVNDLAFVLKALGASSSQFFSEIVAAIVDLQFEKKPFVKNSTGFRYIVWS